MSEPGAVGPTDAELRKIYLGPNGHKDGPVTIAESRREFYEGIRNVWDAARASDADEIARLSQNIVDLILPAHWVDTGQTIVQELTAERDALAAQIESERHVTYGGAVPAVCACGEPVHCDEGRPTSRWVRD